MNTGSVHDRLLAEQRAYYSALAPEYLDQGLDLPGVAELTDALDAFRPAGSVLEFACGPGVWTPQLLRHASDVTAVDASPEMLAIAATRVPAGAPVRFADDRYRTPEELIEGPASSTIERRTPDGTAYRIVKVPHEPADLERQLRELGWDITVTPTAGSFFFWGAGNRAGTPAPSLDARRG
jgi:SAM-dependent methyltransferase